MPHVKYSLVEAVILCLGMLSLNSLTFGHSISATSSSALKDQLNRNKVFFNLSECSSVPGFTQEVRDEIKSKAVDVKKIMDLVLDGSEKHTTYEELALFCDTFGPRLSGSRSLSRAIDYMSKKMEIDSKLKTQREKAMIPRWRVGEQWAEIVKPVEHRMTILALGTSVATNGTLEAPVELVHTFDELDQLGKSGQLSGKIVVYNYNFTTYGESVRFREEGALRASKYGAAAALVRSVTPFSIYSPHAGMGSKSIPTAAITLEDADLIQRWVKRQERVTLKLRIDAENFEDVESHNLIGDIVGSSKPDEVVLVSGHMDSWYNTEGAMDDGGGMMISYKALDVLNKLGLRARRTIRAVLWTAEEFGLFGAHQYFKDHQHELNKFKVVMESDLGTFKPLGLSIKNGSPLAQCVVNEVLALTERIGTTRLDSNYEGSDIEVFTDAGTLGLSLANENSKYFYFHHTSGDSITLENPDDLDKSTILWAVASYVLADLSIDIS